VRDDQFSVVVPFYNSELWLPQLLLSIQGNAKYISEVIVVDDCSSAESFEILSEFCLVNGFSLLRTPKNGGPSSARNLGTSNATSEFVAFHDIDDLWVPSRLGILREVLVKKQNVEFLVNSYGDKSIDDLSSGYELFRMPYLQMYFKNYIQPSCFVVRRESFFPFNERFRYSEDFNYQLSVISRKSRLFLLDAPLTSLGRPQGASGGLSGNHIMMRKGEILAYKLFLSRRLVFLLPIFVCWSIGKHIVRMFLRCLK
jgi:glycosyltransferase involved in cell wall biosynthesis